MTRDELSGWLRLTLTPGVGDSTARKLLASFGPPDGIFQQSLLALRQVVNDKQATALLEEPPELAALVDTTWQWLQGSNGDPPEWRHVAVLGDEAYPAALLTLEDPPLLLYVRGARQVVQHALQQGQNPHTAAVQALHRSLAHSLAVVGSRNPTPQGASNARDFSQALSAAGVTIVSGLALGVDGAAHDGALLGMGPDQDRLATLAVVGTGLDRVYPQAHRPLAHRIAEQGLLISEYPLGTPPLQANFPKRNRLISGLTRGTLVVEAALKSGSLITARLASEQGKDVFAIPGSIHSAQSRGCHALIKQGAKLVENTQDVLEELLPAHPEVRLTAPVLDAPEPQGDDALLEALGFDPVGLDALQARTGLDTAALQVALMTLELDGRLARLPGGLFQRMASA
ncbi:MAG: hypothetical protein RLZZ591_1620 [Pseudomonadota bacterium]|jgi:DNA processing protein